MKQADEKRVAEKIDPTVEDAYWRTHFSKQKYVARNADNAMDQPAYRTGYEGRSRCPGKREGLPYWGGPAKMPR
jgi:hypothetical protein